jgi:hypothetical protein
MEGKPEQACDVRSEIRYEHRCGIRFKRVFQVLFPSGACFYFSMVPL